MAQSTTTTTTMLELPTASPSYPTLVAEIDTVTDTSRSSGSLESTTSTSTSTSTGSSLLPSSLETSHSTSSTTSAASSTSTSTTPSPCPSILLRSASSLTFPSRAASASASALSSSSSASSSFPSISFAPLPQTEPRKRNASHHLGVAARSRLLRHRRMLREHGAADPSYPYGSGGSGGDAADARSSPVEIREAQAGVDADEEARAWGRSHGSHGEREASEEDPLVSLGKLVRGAGKTLWKSLSMRDMRSREKEREKEKEKEREREKEREKGREKEKEKEGAAGEGPGLEGEADDGGEEEKVRVPRGGSLSETRAPERRTQAAHLLSRDADEDRAPSLEGGVWEEASILQESTSWTKLLSDAPTVSEPEPEPENESESENENEREVDVRASGPGEPARNASRRRASGETGKWVAPCKAHTR